MRLIQGGTSEKNMKDRSGKAKRGIGKRRGREDSPFINQPRLGKKQRIGRRKKDTPLQTDYEKYSPGQAGHCPETQKGIPSHQSGKRGEWKVKRGGGVQITSVCKLSLASRRKETRLIKSPGKGLSC